MDRSTKMPASQHRWGFTILGAGLGMTLFAVVAISTRATMKQPSAASDMSTELAGATCSAADRSTLESLGDGIQTAVTSCAKYSLWSGWNSDGTAQCLAGSIHISPTCAHCFSDAVGYAYDHCKSGDCKSDQCGDGCADCLAPAKETAELCVGGDLIQGMYTNAMEVSCRAGIDGMVGNGPCEKQTGKSCSTSSDCGSWSNAQCVYGRCECTGSSCSVNGGECVAPGSCPKYTGGTCGYASCNYRRNAQCIGGWGSGKCMCSEGQCVHDGTCVR